MPNEIQVGGRMPYSLKTERRSDDGALVSLRRRRTWYADDDGNQANGGGRDDRSVDENSPDGVDAPKPSSDDEDLNETVRQLQSEIETSREKITELNAEAKRRRLEKQELLEQHGDYPALLAEARADIADLTNQIKVLQPFKEGYEGVIADLQADNEARIAKLPEESQSMVPEYSDPRKTAGWLNRNWDKVSGRKAPDVDAGAGGGGNRRGERDVEVSDGDRRAAELAAQYGHPVDPKAIAERRKQTENEDE